MSLEVEQTADRGDRFPVTGRAAQPGTTDTDGPLIGDAAGLRASWQRIQAGFVDDPRESVADAAALVERAAQVLVGALRQRQQQLRGMWDTTGARDVTGSVRTAEYAGDPRTIESAVPTYTPHTADAPTATDATTNGTRTTDAATTDAAATDGTRTADSGVVPDSGVGADPRAGGYPGAPARGDTAGASRPTAGGFPDTEQLRLLMRRYRSLLDQICPPR